MLVGWSVGGAAQILYQMKYKTANAVVSLDAASSYEYGWDLISKSIYFDQNFGTPFLQIIADTEGKYNVPRSSLFHENIAKDKQLIRLADVHHGQMPSIGFLIASINGDKSQAIEFYPEIAKFIEKKSP